MPAVTPAALSPIVANTGTKDNAPANTDTPAQAFGHVLAREIQRQDSGTTAQNDTENSAEASNDEAAQAQQTAAAPWLSMLQASTLPSAVQPDQDTTKIDLIPAAGDSGQNINVLAEISTANLLTQPLAGGTLNQQASIDASQNIRTGRDNTAGLTALMANTPSASGKDLPVSGSNTPLFADLLAAQGDDIIDDITLPSSPSTALQAATQATTQANEKNSTPAAQRTISEPVGNARWGDAVAQHVSLMLNKNEQQMEMQLNPPHLGPMEVRLTLGGEQASVMFTSQNAGVREALSVAIPRLTALLADQGIQLTNVQVASDSLNQQAQDQARQQTAFNQHGDKPHESSSFKPDTPDTRRVLTGISLPVARSGVSLYV